MAAHTSNFGQNSDYIVLDLLNEQNGTEFSLADISITTSGAANTKATTMTVTALDGSGYRGTTTHSYNRVLLSEIPGSDETIELEGPVTVGDVLTQINLRFGINLTEVDVHVNGQPLEMVGSDDVTLEPEVITQFSVDANALPGGKVWVGTHVFNLTAAAQLLSSVWGITTLDGLFPPGFVDESGQTYVPQRPGFVTANRMFSLQRPAEYVLESSTIASGSNTHVFNDPYGNAYSGQVNITPQLTMEYLELSGGGTLKWGSLPDANDVMLDVNVSLQRNVSNAQASNLGKTFDYVSDETITLVLSAEGRGNKVYDLMKQMYGAAGGGSAYLMGADGTTYAKVYFHEQMTKFTTNGSAEDEQGPYDKQAVFFTKSGENYVADTTNPMVSLTTNTNLGHNVKWSLSDIAYVRLERAELRNGSIINLDTGLGPSPSAGYRYTFNTEYASWAAPGNPIDPNTSTPYESKRYGVGVIADVKNGNAATPFAWPIPIRNGADLSLGYVTHPDAKGRQVASSGTAVITPRDVAYDPNGNGAWATSYLADLMAMYPNGPAIYSRADSSSTSEDAVQSTYLNPEVIGNGIVFKCSIPRTFLNGRVQLCEFVTNVNYWPYAIA